MADADDTGAGAGGGGGGGGDLSAEQTEKLVIFQEITHIESFDECKQILEAFEWNMESAVQNTFNDPTAGQDGSGEALLRAASSLSSSTSSLASSNPSTSAAAAAFNNDFNQQTNDLFSMSAHTPPPLPQVNGGGGSGYNRFGSSSNSPFQQQGQQLPSVSIVPQHTLSYHAPRDQALVPRGFFQWSVFIIAFPFRFLYSTLLDLVSFFYGLVQAPLPVDYDPLANIAEYAIYYNQRYGTNHPPFYEGSFAQAHAEAKRDLKFLLIYIHQNDNKDCNTFATETLANKDVIDYIANRVLFWSCSKNLPEGQKVFNAMKAKRCPFLGVIVLKGGSRMTLVSRIEGPIGSGELILQLESLIMENEAELVAARHDREQRSQTQLLRQQQDQAYEESLRMDQEKQARKRQLEAAQREAEEQERRRLEEERSKANEIVDRKREARERLAERAQPDAANPLTIKVGVKFPSGNRYERLFLKTDPINELYLFAWSNEECPARFEIATNFPRKVIECDETTATSLEESGVKQSMLLFVCDLDA